MGAGASSATEAAKKATVEDERDLEVAEFALRLSVSLDVQELKHAFSEASPEEVKKLSEALKALEGAGPNAFPIRPQRSSASFFDPPIRWLAGRRVSRPRGLQRLSTSTKRSGTAWHSAAVQHRLCGFFHRGREGGGHGLQGRPRRGLSHASVLAEPPFAQGLLAQPAEPKFKGALCQSLGLQRLLTVCIA